MNPQLRFSTITAAGLILVALLIAPVIAAPALQEGKRASYDLSASITFSHSCSAVSGTVCPMIAMIPNSISLAGTVSWLDTKLTQTTTDLNVSRDITISIGEIPVPLHSVGTIRESVNLANRETTLQTDPLQEMGMDTILSNAQIPIASGLPAGGNWASVLSTLKDMVKLHPVYTIWWVNGPLKTKDTVPVLLLTTTVKSKTTVSGGNLGQRSSWTLTYNFTKMDPQIMITGATTSIAGWYGYSLKVGFVFNYDEKNDMLLSAAADIQAEFHSTISVSCTSPPNCLTTKPVPVMSDFSFVAHSSLKLASTNLSPSEKLTTTTPTSSDSSTSSSTTTSTTSATSTTDTQGYHSSDTQSSKTSTPASNPSVGSSNSKTAGPVIFGIMSSGPTLWGLLLVIAGIIGVGAIAALRARKRIG